MKKKFKVLASKDAKIRNNLTATSSVHSRKIVAARKEYDSLEDWYYSNDGESDNYTFAETLEREIKRLDSNCIEVFIEPSIQGLSGSDYIYLTMEDGSQGTAIFDYMTEQETILSDGPEKAAKYYAQRALDEADFEEELEDDDE